MLIKSEPDEIQSYLADASYLASGSAFKLFLPETENEVLEVLSRATRDKTPVTISGAGTGTVAGRVPFDGVILATDRLNRIREVRREDSGGRVVAQCGVRLIELQQFVDSKGLFYPPDPTERGCFLGGTIATNASGARTFKYGPTRDYVLRLRIALATGDVTELVRGQLRTDATGRFSLGLKDGRVIEARIPTYSMPKVRKHASGYYCAPEMDVLDLFIGSEGTLGVILEAELKLLRRPEGLLSGVVFFGASSHLLAFVRAVRITSLEHRRMGKTDCLDARALEYFDRESLVFLRQKYAAIPEGAEGAVFFEQEISEDLEQQLLDEWLTLLESHNAFVENSWFASNPTDHGRLREFRHQLPVLMNEWFARYRQRKVSTDMAVPDEEFAGLLRFYEDSLEPSGLRYTIFGHIGDNHVHVNILPRDDDEAAKARAIYQTFIERALRMGGTVSAEHGIGKLKREYLKLMYGENHLREMAALKMAFDPAGILCRGNMFSEDYLQARSS